MDSKKDSFSSMLKSQYWRALFRKGVRIMSHDAFVLSMEYGYLGVGILALCAALLTLAGEL